VLTMVGLADRRRDLVVLPTEVGDGTRSNDLEW